MGTPELAGILTSDKGPNKYIHLSLARKLGLVGHGNVC